MRWAQDALDEADAASWLLIQREAAGIHRLCLPETVRHPGHGQAVNADWSILIDGRGLDGAIIWARERTAKTRQQRCRAFETRVTYRQGRGFQVARKRVGVFQKAKGLSELGRSS